MQQSQQAPGLVAASRAAGGGCGAGFRLPRLIRRPLSCLLGGGESTLDSAWAAGQPELLRQDSWTYRRSLQLNEDPEAQPALVTNGISRSCCGRTEQRTVVLTRRGPSFGFSLVGSQPVRVGRVELNSAAEAAGLRVGDAIVGAGGRIVLTSGCESLVRRIRGGSSRLELRIQRWLSNCSSCSDTDEPDRAAAQDRDFEADEEESDASSSLELSSFYRATDGAQPIRTGQRPQSMYYPFRPLPSQPIRAMNPEQARLYPPAGAAQRSCQPVGHTGQRFQPIRSQECFQPIGVAENRFQPIADQDAQQPMRNQEYQEPIRSQEFQQPIRAVNNRFQPTSCKDYPQQIRSKEFGFQPIRRQQSRQSNLAAMDQAFQPIRIEESRQPAFQQIRSSVPRPQPIRSQESQPQRAWLRQQSFLQATGACRAASPESSDSASPRASPGGESSSSGVSSTAAAAAAGVNSATPTHAPTTPGDILDAGNPVLSSRLQWHRRRPGGCRAQALLLPRLLMLARLDSVEGDGDIRDDSNSDDSNDVGVFRLSDCVRAEFDFAHNGRLMRLTFRADGEVDRVQCPRQRHGQRRIILEAPCGLVKERWRRCLVPLLQSGRCPRAAHVGAVSAAVAAH